MREWPLSMMRSSRSRTRRTRRSGNDVDARHHDLAHRLLAKLDHAGDHLAFVFLEVGVAFDQVAQAFLGVRRRGAALDAQQAAQGVLEHVQRHQDDEQQPIQHLDRTHERERHVLGSSHREHAPEELRQQQHQHAHDAKRDGQPGELIHMSKAIQKPLAAAAHSASV